MILTQCCVAIVDFVDGMGKNLRMIQVLLDQFRDANQPPTPHILQKTK
jgi:hypothetical protein